MGPTEVSVCRSCGSQQLMHVGACAPFPAEWEVLIRGEAVASGDLFRCRDCGLGQRQPCIAADDLPEIYRNSPIEAMDYRFEDNSAWMAARRFLQGRWGAQVDRSVLDIGCHTGLFLGGLPEPWRRFGIEGAEAPRSVARERFGIEMVGERLETVGDEWEARFDAVCLFDVAEHLVNPHQGLQLAAALVRPGGVLLLSTADFDAWTWRVSAGRHWYLQTPQHLSVLSRQFIERFAADSNLWVAGVLRIPHQRGSFAVRCKDWLETVYAGLRDRGGAWRIPQHLLHSLPGMGQLRSMENIRWSMRLRDHMFVVLEKSKHD